MLIISPFSDYYDGVASSGVDTTIRYHRQTSILITNTPFYIDHLPNTLMGRDFDVILANYRSSDRGQSALEKSSCELNILGFCGIYIVTARVGQLYYFGEDILNCDWSRKKSYRKTTVHQSVTNLIHQFHGQQDNTLFQQFKTPLFHVPLSSSEHCTPQRLETLQATFTLNPNLKDLQFQKYKDAYSTFQDLQSYISGILGITTPETIELSDRSKIIKAGFDPKISFRKGKQLPK
jgi:hypothetical protein